MPLRTTVDVQGFSSQQRSKKLLAFAIILLAWTQIANAQVQQQRPRSPQQADARPSVPEPPSAGTYDSIHDEKPPVHGDAIASVASAARGSAHVVWHSDSAPLSAEKHGKESTLEEHIVHQQHARRSAARNHINNQYDNNQHDNNKKSTRTDQNLIPDDESAVATSALAKAVRAPSPPRHQRPSSAPASGLASPQNARSLEDWEVGDFVLLATVDGDLFANDRRTGKQLWHLQVDQPMVETIHYRTNTSVLDEDFSPVDHYIWAIEPTRDGGVYIWVPAPDARLRTTGFTMRELVEVLSPYSDDETSIVYVGDKKTTMITLDAATGRIMKWFGAGGSQVNEADSCLNPNGLFDREDAECSSVGTITLGRTEYTVSINRRDGKGVATLRYSEWTPNNRDSDLFHQYHVSKDSKYITTRHDGKVYAFDYAGPDNMGPLFSQKFAAPVARVFDVCRPWDAEAGSSPEFVLLPQPAMPSQNEDVALKRSNSIFLNRTEGGSWYALSGRAYPLIIGAPSAKASFPEWWDETESWESLTEAKVSRGLVGTHSLASFEGGDERIPTLPAGASPGSADDADNRSVFPMTGRSVVEEPTIVDKVKNLPQSAAKSVVDFVRNPILIIIFFAALVYHEKKLRRAYHRLRSGSSFRDVLLYLSSSDAGSAGRVDWRHSKPTEAEAEVKQIAKPEPVSRFTPNGHQSSGSDVSVGSHTRDEDAGVPKDELTGEAEDVLKPLLSQTSGNGETEESGPGTSIEIGLAGSSPGPEKKKARRGRRGGVKHRKGRQRDASQSRDAEAPNSTVEEAVSNAKKLGDGPSIEPDVMTVAHDADDMQAVSGPIIRMGNIEVNTNEPLGTGSNGTLVFAGKFDGREVAVKRMLIQFYDIASQETRLLRESDDHPNVVRYYAQQVRDGFLYIALERCVASLADIVDTPGSYEELAEAGRADIPGVLYQITNGISHLHSLRIVHRDLKPHNILVNRTKDGKPRLLVSDFGLCKKLEGGQSSFGATTGRAAGTSGWRAPELLLDDDGDGGGGGGDLNTTEASGHSGSGSVLVQDGALPHNHRATRAIDIFSLGLVFFFVLTNGSHPFDSGGRYMREINIRKGNHNLQPLDALGDFAHEAKDLIGSMLEANPKRRPSAVEVMSHPFFWPAKKRLAFLCDVSDHFEKEPRDPPSAALQELERHAAQVIKGDFLRLLPREFVDSLGKQRKYTGSRLLDLLRALRNKRNHYEDMADALKRQVGPLPDGYLGFWAFRFPQLLLVCWNVVYMVQWEETDRFREYYQPAGL